MLIKSASNTVEGNFIGTDPGGTLDRGNGGDGVRIESFDNLIGGPANAAQNVISGNDDNGVSVDGESTTAAGNVISNNHIGTDENAEKDLGNSDNGVHVFFAPDVVVGGTGANGAGQDDGEGNIISGNNDNGVLIDNIGASGARVLGNFIGLNRSGNGVLGNTLDGVRVRSAPQAEIGGTGDGQGNTISGNLNNGVMILGDAATGNSVLRNSIFGNGSPGGLGIALNNDGVTANDNKDPGAGPNKLQNFPVITSASATTIEGTLNSRPSKTFTIQFFSNPAPNIPTGFGEGETFLGQKTVTTNDRGRVSFTFATSTPLTAGEFVTATATDASDNTSEFSAAREVR